MSQNQKAGFSPLSAEQLNKITQSLAGMSQEQLIWTSGFVAGMAQNHSATEQLATTQATSEATSVTVLYGSQTGNAKHAAEDYHRQLTENSIQSTVVSMADYKPRKLKDESNVVIFVSTHGEGDAPDDAIDLHEFVGGKKAPKLNQLNYAVVALGDSSYEFFCQTGKDFDERLRKLGATELLPRLDCDVEYEAELASWSTELTEKFKSISSASTQASAVVESSIASTSAVKYTKAEPFSATLIEAQKITGRDSVKDIRHIEISLENSGIQYKPGDALGVWFINADDVVDRIIKATSCNASDTVELKGESLSLSEALTQKCELTLSYPGFVKAYQEASGDSALNAVLADKPGLRTFLEERQIVDIVEQFPADISAQQLINALRPITPRLYSIASSQAEVEDEVHLTVAHVAYDAFGFEHQGGASGFLATRLDEGQEVKVYVENNDNFRLPADDNVPVIMVGPGTGIAPFRAFMQERDSRDAEGQNWLFFGNPNFTQDFLYQVEWQGYLKSGLLSKISLAFSRDQKDKIYVQDRLVEHGKEVFEWLEQGAHFYVCGDAMRMAKDVENALIEIVRLHGERSLEEAKKYVVELRKAKRYQKDVY